MPFHSVTPHRGIHQSPGQKSALRCSQEDSQISVFLIAEGWEYEVIRYPTMAWVSKQWSICAIEYFSAGKKMFPRKVYSMEKGVYHVIWGRYDFFAFLTK
jgi:hypothetical protein